MRRRIAVAFCLAGLGVSSLFAQPRMEIGMRERISIGKGWKFYKYQPGSQPDSLIYDTRPEILEEVDGKPADAKPTEAVKVKAGASVLKPWILPSGNDFVKDPAKWHRKPEGNPGARFPFVQADFDDRSWENVNVPHDWAINGPFYTERNAVVGGGMGRLPIQGVAWYRKKLDIPASDRGRSVYLEVDGAMSYAIVWLNGKLVGGWPNGYSSWRLDLTPYILPGKSNQLAIRIDNPRASSRWYPGAGIYRNIWLVKTSAVQVAHWGTSIQTRKVSAVSATVDLKLALKNRSTTPAQVQIETKIYLLSADGKKQGAAVAGFKKLERVIKAGAADTLLQSITFSNPKLWGPPPAQTPNRYTAVTMLSAKGKVIDTYETPFGIREVKFDANEGVFVNGQKVYIKGANQHHDLGALGAAFNWRAAERQLEILREMGCNAIRMSHNPPAPELLDLTDQMGFLVIDEVYDSWELKKTPLDFHLIFPDWYEQDLRALLRRDRNHPSVILWSFGNEVGEQYTGAAGGAVAKKLHAIAKEEDPTRPLTLAMNYAKPDMELPAVADVIGLNYQGEGIRNGPAYSGLKGITTPPLYPAFHQKYPDKVIISTENAAAVSSRGEYFFPVFEGNSAPVRQGSGGDFSKHHVSAYELYSVDFGSSADKVFATLEQHPYVAGGFVWSGFDYLGEPTPYYTSRSSYFGVIDLAGFKKDRFYLYQSHWRPELPMAHILPHWNWPNRISQVTPVHVFTSGDEAELFLNGRSLGRKKKGQYEYRLRWDEVKYEPGELKVIAYKKGKKWAEDRVSTSGAAARLEISADKRALSQEKEDLAFITVRITDRNTVAVPDASNRIKFSIEGPAELLATDNGDPTDMQSFSSFERKAFNGLVLAIIRLKPNAAGAITIKAESSGLKSAETTLQVSRFGN